jgi:hypothetical protein
MALIRNSAVRSLLWSFVMRVFMFALAVLGLTLPVRAQDVKEIDLFGRGMEAFKGPKHSEWFATDEVVLDPHNPRRLFAKEAKGNIWVNGLKGRTNDLYTSRKFGDVDVHLEFVMAKGSNSGIKLHGHYEIQICDSYGKADDKMEGEDCGGVYPRAELRPSYHHIDKGIAPKLNACKAPGEWQTLDLSFVAPRFDKDGKKVANARLTKVTLNGKTIHEDVELKTPTGDRWQNAEMAEGPIMLQGDHGPVAFRRAIVRAK